MRTLRFALLALLILALHPALAQQPKVLAPHKPVAPRLGRHREWDKPAASQISTGALWMTDGSFKSTLYLSNMLKEDPLTVTPVLHLANGVAYTLEAVTLEPSGTAAININQSLAKQGVAPYATLSGYVEVQYQWGWPAVCGSVWNVDTRHSLIFVYGLRPATPFSVLKDNQVEGASTPSQQVLEGPWWKEEPNVAGFVALSNVTSRSIDALVETLDAGNRPIANHSVTISPNGTKIVELTELLSVNASGGGVVVSWTGSQSELAVNSSLQDPSVGYSARLPLGPRPDASAKISQDSLAELGLMAGTADPMMSFPSGVVFTPYSVARNLSEQPVTVTPTLWWMQAGTARSVQLQQFTVAPHQTVKLDLRALLASAGLKNFQGSFNLAFGTDGPKGALLLTGGSVDQSYTYVFEVVTRGIGESASKGLAYWSTANGDDTMVTVWNPADEAQDFVFTLLYSGGHYLYPMHLEARVSHTFNISEIVHSGLPDSEGNIVPAAIQSGSAEIGGPLGENQLVLVTMDSGIYNVRKATCGPPPCETCNGFTSVFVADDPFAVAVGGTKQQAMTAQWNTGTYYDYTLQSNWSSSNTGVATVNSGLVNGVNVGSVTVSAVLYAGIPPYAAPCGNPLPSCPSGALPGASAPGNSNPTVTFGDTPLVPLGKPVQTTATVNPSTNTTPITLSISTTSGTGSATFGNGNSTMTITTTTSVTLVGVTASSTPNNMELDAKVGSTIVGSTVFTVTSPINGAIPVNFRQTSATIKPDAVLEFQYTWDSSSGSKTDLSTCQVEEYVTYVGPNPYPWASPPYLAGYVTSWPSTGNTPVSASVSGLVDDQLHQPGWQKAYAYNFAASDQKFQFQCPYYNNNQWVQLMPMTGTIPISRVVNLTNGNPPWTYQITKSGLTASINLP